MQKRQLLTTLLLVVLSLALSSSNAQAIFYNIATIDSPGAFQTLNECPVAVTISFHKTINPNSFKAWLNGRNVTRTFDVTDTGATALLTLEDGLRCRETDRQPIFKGKNLLKIKTKQSKWRVDIDYRIFSVDLTNTKNHPPAANAGADQTAFIGDTVTLDGSASTDLDGDVLTYFWTLDGPEGSQAQLSDPTVIRPSFEIDAKGIYTGELIVNDGKTDSEPDQVLINTQNSFPVAALHADPDGNVTVGTLVTLDGSGSTDVDGDPLAFAWSLVASPADSNADLEPSPTDPALNFLTPDFPGNYVIELIVNDGEADSEPDQIVVTTENNPPVAVIESPEDPVQTIQPVTFDGSSSYDPDGDDISCTWSLISLPDDSTAVLDITDFTCSLIPDKVGEYVAQLIVSDLYADSTPVTALIAAFAVMPDVIGVSRVEAESLIQETGISTISTISDYHEAIPAGLVFSQSPGPGTAVSASDTVSVWVSLGPNNVSVPNVVSLTQSAAEAAITAPGLVVGTLTEASSNTLPAGSVIIQDPAAGTLVLLGTAVDLSISTGPSMPTVPNLSGQPLSTAQALIKQARLTVGATTTATNSSIPVGYVISHVPPAGEAVAPLTAVDLIISLGSDGSIPPDPGDVAPMIEDGVSTSLFLNTDFLYNGPVPIQTGVTTNAIQPKRVAVIKGNVFDRSSAPLSGVVITIQNHPEYGQTLSREDGRFDLTVNGGHHLTVQYKREGYLPLYRQVDVPWQDYVYCKDAVMTALDPTVTTLDLFSDDPIKVARGSVITDAHGTRQATVLVPQGTEALILHPDESIEPIETLSFRATEYTVGPEGPKAMPAALPLSSAYTYCVELSADEALGNGVKINGRDVIFTQPIFFYLENFLDFPVGVQVPVGYYIQEENAWQPYKDGRVIQIVGIDTSGLAELDTDGDGDADGDDSLNMMGIFEEERQKLSELYPVGQTLWRVPMEHFSSPDLNFGAGPSPAAKASNGRIPTNSDPKIVDPSFQSNYGAIDIQNRVFHETIDLVGSNFNLHYSSDRVPGRKAAYTIDIPLRGDEVPDECKRIEVEIHLAGHMFTQTFDAGVQEPYTFEWDGLDTYGRELQGTQTATVRVGYVYDAYYQDPPELEQTFGLLSGIPMSASPAREEITLWQEQQTTFNIPCTWFSLGQAIGGWTLNAHHAYDVSAGILHLGTGETRYWDSGTRDLTIEAAAGTGIQGFEGDGGPALSASLNEPWGVDVAADGSIYFADSNNDRIRIIRPDGIIETIAGGGSGGEGSAPLEARITHPSGVALKPNGDFYISEYSGCRVRMVATSNEQTSTITTVAGTGESGYSGDGGPAANAKLSNVGGIAVAPDGSIYIADTFNHRIRRIGPNGIITTVAGNGVSGYNGDNIPATSANLNLPFGVAIGPDGSIYIADTYNQRIRRVGANGLITTVAGNGVWASAGDGETATEASISYPYDIDVSLKGDLFIAETDGHKIRRVNTEGTITTLAGTGENGDVGDNGPPASAMLSWPYGVAAGPDGTVCFCQFSNRIRKIQPAIPVVPEDEFTIAARDGAAFYRFDASGRHLTTHNAVTGTALLSFGYDENGRLTTVTDAYGNVTTIERNQTGSPTALIAPFGQRTELALDANGYLVSVTNPAGEPISLLNTTDGLLVRVTSSKGDHYDISYDADGLIKSAENPEGGSNALTYTGTPNGYAITNTSAEGIVATYQVQESAIGEENRTFLAPDNTQGTVNIDVGGDREGSLPNGSVISMTRGPDPRFGMLAPLTTEVTVNTPYQGSVLSYTIASEKTVTLSDPSDITSLVDLTRTASLNGKTYQMVFDRAAMSYTATTPEGRSAITQIDETGRPIEVQHAGLGKHTLVYNGNGKITSVTHASDTENRQTTYDYNNSGYVAAATDNIGRSVNFEYSLAGRVTRQTLPGNREVVFQYDINGNLTSLSPPGKPAHAFTYNTVDDIVGYTPPDVGTGLMPTTYAYNQDRKLSQISQPDGQLITYDYDTAGRIEAIASSTAGELKRYVYDAATGHLAAITSADGIRVGYNFDGGLLTELPMSGEASGGVSYHYNNDLQVSQIDVSGTTSSIYYTYDNDGLVTGVGFGQPDNMLNLTRNPNHGMITTSQFGTIVTDSRQYDDFGELTAYEATCSGAPCLMINYTHDGIGRIEEKTETIEGVTSTYRYTYNEAGSLIEVRNGSDTLLSSYSYDTNGNRLSGPGLTTDPVYDAQDRLLTYGNTTFDYTNTGHLKTKTDLSDITSYAYDAFGNLKSVALPDGHTISYLVDGKNRRVGKKINGSLVKGFLYAGGNSPIAELDGSNNVVSLFFYTGGSNVPSLMLKGSVPYRIISDHLGSPRLIVNTQTGAMAQRMDYNEFGVVIIDTNPGFQPFGFAGGLYDPDTGLTRFGARDYNPEIGRWTAKDPILFAAKGTNLYGYVLNDPINLIDPSGLGPKTVYDPTEIVELDPSGWNPITTIMAGVSPLGIPGGISFNTPATGTSMQGFYTSSTGETSAINTTVKEVIRNLSTNCSNEVLVVENADKGAMAIGALGTDVLMTVLGGESILLSVLLQSDPDLVFRPNPMSEPKEIW